MNPQIESYIADNRQAFVDRLMDLLRIPCISTDPSQKAAMAKAAEWVQRGFQDLGLAAEIVRTSGHPAVLADTGPADGPTLLVYGHYDVQPARDEALWESPPFEPTIRDGIVYARGAADDKGQFLTHVFGLEAWAKTVGMPPARVKFLIEGEEEIGSPNLADLIRSERDRLACDYVVLSDTPKFSADLPAITYGTKGMVYKELIVRGPKQNLHSGSFGGTIENPGNALAGVIGELKDDNHRVTIPGFYDAVQELTVGERQMMKSLPFDESGYLEGLGCREAVGEVGYATLVRRWARPTLDVNGLYGGYMGEGASTIIPAEVGAKVSMRIVPDQDPREVSEAFDKTVQALLPAGVDLEIKTHALAAPYVCPLDCPGLEAAVSAVEAAYGVKPAMIREGGTLPILALFREVLGAESIMMGFCDPNCNAHGPNEFFAIEDLIRGTKACAGFLGGVAGR